jgi:hypothetical protein
MECAPASSIRIWMLTVANLVCLALLLAWQGWLTLGLFGSAPWTGLTNQEPITSGTHPRQLYLGYRGAYSLARTGTNCVYDWMQAAGYPKTPIFDGSRGAEVVLFLNGGEYEPRAYKFGVVAACLLAPLLLWIAGWGFGLCLGGRTIAVAFSILIWWGPQGRTALESGELELWMASLAVIAHMGLLIRYDRHPGMISWMGLFATAAMGWFCQPLLFPIALPLLLMYYLSAGVRHGSVSWHLMLLVVQVAAFAVNLFWLTDWVSFWWLRSPLPGPSDMLAHRTIRTLWEAPLWGGCSQRGLALGLLALASLGIVLMNRTRQRPAARLLMMGSGGMTILAFLGISWEPLGEMGTSALLGPALCFACPAAGYGFVRAIRWLMSMRYGRVALGATFAAAAFGAYWGRGEVACIVQRTISTEPLQIGLTPEQRKIVDTLVLETDSEHRILWEDLPIARTTSHWAALLPILTGRPILGGLDPHGSIEHSQISFLDEMLQGRHISTWSDRSLDEYVRRYNVGWVAAWSPATIKRFAEWSGVERAIPLEDGRKGFLYVLKKSDHGYVLRGHATVVQADGQRLTLADVVPENGVIVLSYHWQAGLKASPDRVQAEREPSGHDPIGFLRLRTSGPVARVTLTWEPQR